MAIARMDAAQTTAPMNENQRALLAFTEHLQQRTIVPTVPGPIAAAAAATLPVDGHLARRRVEAFLDQQRADRS
jgi:hypothetical protein